MIYKYYLFDFDGVLVDSMDTWAGVHINALKQAGIPIPQNFVETITPLGNYKASEYTISLGLNVSLETYLKEVSEKLYQEYTTNVPLKPFVKETLSLLKEKGVSLNVLTASPHLYVDECLKRHGVFELFENVWTIDDFRYTKADPELFKNAAEKLNANIKNCTMLDDNFTAISTAKKSGMNTIAVYDKSSEAFEQILRETADKYIFDFSQING